MLGRDGGLYSSIMSQVKLPDKELRMVAIAICMCACQSLKDLSKQPLQELTDLQTNGYF